MLLVMPVSKRARPIQFYWDCLFREAMGQLETIGGTVLKKLWANRRFPAASGIGPTPFYLQYCFGIALGAITRPSVAAAFGMPLGHHAIGNACFKGSQANSIPSGLPL